MPATLTDRPAAPAAQYPRRKHWTRAELAIVEATGIFEQQHLELVAGELIDKMPKNRPHVDAAALLLTLLIQLFGGRRVNSDAPIDVAPEDNPTNAPEPDIIVLNRDFTGFRSAQPQASDLDLIVEISDTSLAFDLTTKAALYARAGIIEYWVVDVVSRRVLVHRNPQDGNYESVTSYDENESVAPLAAPESSLAVREIFPE